LFALFLGLVFCFAGYRVFLVMLPIWGFFAGFWLALAGAGLIMQIMANRTYVFNREQYRQGWG
jgi:hypothetical protein